MQTLVERGCGLDVHQATVVACLLVVLKNGKVRKQMRTFGTTTRELLSLRQWLLSEGCTHVAMESTTAVVDWTARKTGFEFHSNLAGQTTVHAEVGKERNGVFFS